MGPLPLVVLKVIVTVDPAHTGLGETLVTVILVCPCTQTATRENNIARQNLRGPEVSLRCVNESDLKEKPEFL